MIGRTLRGQRAQLAAIGSLLCAAILTACGGETAAPGSGATLVSITASPSSGHVAVGQSITVTVIARDLSGNVMGGINFAWNSSNPSVATVVNGIVTGVSVGTTSIMASSGSVVSNQFNLTVTGATGAAASLVVDKVSLLLNGIGQSAPLAAQILNAQGAPTQGTVTWTSSAPGKVSVSSAGQVQALAVGSAQIIAESGGVKSLPTLVTVAVTQPGALLVSDAQVVSVGPLTTVGVAVQYQVTLQGVTAPATGSVVIATGNSPVAGKVVSTQQQGSSTIVTLLLVPIYQLFTNYDISFRLDISKFPIEAVATQSAGKYLGAALEPFKAFDCDGEVEARLLGKAIELSVSNNLNLIIEDHPGYSKHALEGSLTVNGDAGLKLKAEFHASGKCEAQGQVKLPIFGWFSVIAMPAVRMGLGVELEGDITAVEAELGIHGVVGLSGSMGWECGGVIQACQSLDQIAPINTIETKSKMPRADGMKVKVSAQFYVLAGLDATFLGGVLNAQIVEARIGPKQSFDIAFPEDQASRTDYASTYDLKIEAVVEPGSALKEAIKKVIDDDAVGVKFKAESSLDISESPKGSLSINKVRTRPAAPVEFNVDFAPTSSVAYWILGYNVEGVELWRKREDESKYTKFKDMNLIGSNKATYQWTPTEAEAGKYEFVAFVVTKLVPPLLEVKPNSVQPLEVSCFSGGAQFALSQMKPATGLLTSSMLGDAPAGAAVCIASTWAGPTDYVAKTPGLPGDNITTHANITWVYDSTISGNGFSYYDASGSFSLAFNSTNGCTYSLSPNMFTIVKDPLTPSRLGIIDNGFTPATYGFGGSQLVNFTSTASCPNSANVVTQFSGFLVNYAFGTGPYTFGQFALTGTINDAATTSTWNFIRP